MLEKPDFIGTLGVHRFSYNHNRTDRMPYNLLGRASEEKALKGCFTMRPYNHHIRFDFFLKIQNFFIRTAGEHIRFNFHFFRLGKHGYLLFKILFTPFLGTGSVE